MREATPDPWAVRCFWGREGTWRGLPLSFSFDARRGWGGGNGVKFVALGLAMARPGGTPILMLETVVGSMGAHHLCWFCRAWAPV